MNDSSFPDISKIKDSFKGIIFDLDGTILDSMKLWNEVDIRFLSMHGYEVTHDYTEYVKSVSIDDAALYTKERYNLDESPEEIKGAWNDMVAKAYKHDVMLFAGVKEYIREAHASGLKIAAATALIRSNAEAALKNNGVLDYFTSLVTLEDLGSAIDKSRPDVYLKAASSLGLDAGDCLVFEDVPKALCGAKLGGFKTCAVYDPIGAGSDDAWADMCKNADFSIRNWMYF